MFNFTCRDAAKTLEASWQKSPAEKEAALAALTSIMNDERVKEVEAVKSAGESVRVSQVNQLRQEMERAVQQGNQEVEKERAKISERNRVIQRVQKKREELYDELLRVQADYQDFIDKYPRFDPGQTGYLLPDFRQFSNIENPYTDKTVQKYNDDALN